jgi:flagellar motility protein MotE (MotC chaperone)
MKKLLTVVVLTLAMNFLAAAGAVGWLFQSGHLDKAKVAKVRELVFPPPATQPSVEVKAGSPATQPTLRLDELLATQRGRSAVEKVDFIQRTFDAQMLDLDRRQRDLSDLKRQVDLANEKLAADRAALEKEKKALSDREQETEKLQTDKGFQDSLQLYTSLPPKQVKTIFMTLSVQTAQQYLEAMNPRAAAKIMKEFKSPTETQFIQQVLENMRQAQTAADVQKQP